MIGKLFKSYTSKKSFTFSFVLCIQFYFPCPVFCDQFQLCSPGIVLFCAVPSEVVPSPSHHVPIKVPVIFSVQILGLCDLLLLGQLLCLNKVLLFLHQSCTLSLCLSMHSHTLRQHCWIICPPRYSQSKQLCE